MFRAIVDAVGEFFGFTILVCAFLAAPSNAFASDEARAVPNQVWVWVGEDEIIYRCEVLYARDASINPCAPIVAGQRWHGGLAGTAENPTVPLFEDHPTAWDPQFAENPFIWYASYPYPRESLILKEQGTVTYNLHIAADGTVTGCKILVSSNSSTLDAATCDILQNKGHFLAGHTVAGIPMPGTIGGAINWYLPGSPRLKQSADVRLIKEDIAADGERLGCTAHVEPDDADLEKVICDSLQGSKEQHLRSKRSFKTDHVIVTSQVILSFDGDQPVGELYKLPGENLRDLLRERYTIAQDGSIKACELLERRGRTLARCTKGPFDPFPDQRGDRHATYVEAVSVAKVAP